MQGGLKNDRRTIFGWAMYDWANSAYTTTTLAVLLPVIFTDQVIGDEGYRIFGRTFDGESLWSFLVSFGAIGIFLLSPFLGAIGDFSASKLRFLRLFAYLGALASTLFFFVASGDFVITVILFLVVEGSWAIAAVFYDSFLPHISTPETMDRVSSKGFAFGYIGGGLQFLLALLLIQFSPEDFQETAARIAIVFAGLWWFGFAVYAFRRLREPTEAEPLPEGYRTGSRAWTYARLGFARTIATTRRLPQFPQLLLFLVAFLLYNDGVQTVISISAAYASETLKLEQADIALAFLVVQVVAFGGAFLFGRISVWVGAKRAILLSLVLWCGVAVLGYLLPEGEFLPFAGLAASVGLVLGGTQALSRSLYGSMIPEEASAEFYGFYSVFSKFSAIWGPIIFGVVNTATGSSRNAILSLIGQFVVGFVLLFLVNVDKAREAREHWRFRGAAAAVEEGS
jgi:UMF1 family MFS transporter